MLLLSNALLNKPVMSLRTGGQIATALAPVINPNNLKIEGFYCEDRFTKEVLVLVSSEIRDIIDQGFVVNDHDALAAEDEIVRLKDIFDLRFELLGKPVVTTSREKVGKVNDFAADNQTLYIQKLYVGQSLLKSLSTGQLSVDRNNIIEITNRKIVINEILRPTKSTAPMPVSPLA
jgi:sporulation protein YlmC with PRC-barrel domain